MNPQDGSFSPGDNLPEGPLSIHCVVNISPTEVFLAGGVAGAAGNPTRKAYKIDVSDESNFRWTTLQDMPIPRAAHTCNLVNNEVVVVG